MKRTAIMTVSGLLLAMTPTATLVTQAGAADSAKVTFIHLSTWAAGQDNPMAVCVDGTKIEGPQAEGLFNVTDSSAELVLTPGVHTVAFIQDGYWNGTDCGGEGAIVQSFTVAAGDNVTIGLDEFKPNGDVNDPSYITVWNDMASCIEPGKARIGARSTAVAYTEGGPSPVSVWGEVGGTVTMVAEGLEYGDQAGKMVSAPATYVDLTASADMVDEKLAVAGDVTLQPGTGRMAYVYGGTDGDVGIFVGPVMNPGTCQIPSTTTTSTTSTTLPAVRSQAVTPRFAG